MENDWIAKYYERIVTEGRVSLERRDRVTHWSYTILGVFMGAYVGLSTTSVDIDPALRFALTATILAIMTRFFFQSVVAYGFFTRHRYIRTKIEEYWANGSDIKELKSCMQAFDHGKQLPVKKNKIVSQIRSGPLGLILPTALLINDFEMGSVDYYVILIMLMVYVFFEILNYVTYDQMRIKKS